MQRTYSVGDRAGRRPPCGNVEPACTRSRQPTPPVLTGSRARTRILGTVIEKSTRGGTLKKKSDDRVYVQNV